MLGQRAELAAADFLFADGFAILARNVRVSALEIDIVARREDLLALVEVRTRGSTSYESAFQSVSRVKLRRMRLAAAGLWRQRRLDVRGIGRVRIDVAAVTFAGRDTMIEYAVGVA